MMVETILAVLAVVAFLSAVIMTAFAWKLNSDWCKIGKQMMEIHQDEHMMMMAMMAQIYEDEFEEDDINE